jgi:hypothetical protein
MVILNQFSWANKFYFSYPTIKEDSKKNKNIESSSFEKILRKLEKIVFLAIF